LEDRSPLVKRTGKILKVRLGYNANSSSLASIVDMLLFGSGAAVAALSVVGIPPTAGFISKWYLILGNIEGGNYLYVVVLLVGAILAAVYCFRVIIFMFFLPGKEGAWEGEFRDAAPSMLSPVWILSLGTLFFGVFSYLLIPSLLKAAEFLL
jgi:multicomponent Na+:H+ antiporter subunit D